MQGLIASALANHQSQMAAKVCLCLCVSEHAFLDGYCSTVQGLLDWFEVNVGFTELLFIQIDVCVMCVFAYVCRSMHCSCVCVVCCVRMLCSVLLLIALSSQMAAICDWCVCVYMC